MQHIYIYLLLAALTACGGGGGGGSAPGGGVDSTPKISNLQYFPTSALQYTGEGTQAVSGSFDFVDAGKDLKTVHLVSSDGSSITSPIEDVAGIASGSIQALLQTDTTQIGKFSFQVYVSDAGGRRSNALSGSFEVKPNDSGARWTLQSYGLQAGAPLWQRRIRWTGSLFISVGDALLSSPDAQNWTRQTTGISSVLNDVAWVGNRFVAVGADAKILTSPDATTWSSQTVPSLGAATLNGVAASASRMVAVGTQVDPISGSSIAMILTSPNGVSWSVVPGTIQAALYAVVWSGDRFVAVGSSLGQPNAQAIALTSPDGLAWSIHLVNVSTLATLYDIAWNGSRFVATGYAGAATSTDGANWQPAGLGVVGPGNALAWSGQHFLSCGVVYCQSSADGIQWLTAAQLPGSGASVYGIAWNGTKWAVVGSNSYVASSP